MADKGVLTQEEIDALLSGVEEDDTAEDVNNPSAQVIADYDLTNQDRVVRGRMPTLELISERFARKFRAELPASLKVPIEVGPGGVQVIKYSEYVDTLAVPTCIKLLKIEPFDGNCLVTLDATLVHGLVDMFFGGDGNVEALQGREFTVTESKVIDRMVALILQNYRNAWQDVMAIEIKVVGEEVNPNHINVLAGSEILMVCSFRLDAGSVSGELHIAFPYASLESYRSILDTTNKSDQQQSDGVWRKHMQEALLDAELPINCVIGETQIRLRELMTFQPGDVIQLDLKEKHQVRIANIPTFNASLGDSRGKFALEFEDFIPR